MLFFRLRTLQNKLILLAVASAMLAVFLSCVGLEGHNVSQVRELRLEQLKMQARMLATSGAHAIQRQDATAANWLLGSLASEPAVLHASLHNLDGECLAAYGLPRDQADFASGSLVPGLRFADRSHVELCVPSAEQGQLLGYVVMRAKVDDFAAQIAHNAEVVLLVVLVSVSASLLFAALLQARISRPIHRLVEAADRITRQGDYSTRVQAESADELGQLCDSFNRMLDRVAASESDLRAAHELLEKRVRDRTAELESEVARREAIQEDLATAKSAAEAANRAKSEFLANMSHEIRTPLNGILGFADMLLKGADQGNERDREDFLQTIRTSGRHLLTLINDILDLSKIEAGQLVVERRRCSPHEVLAGVVSVLRVNALEKGVKLEYAWSTSVPETIETDESRLRQLLTNLVGNAVKFTQQGEVKLGASVVTEDNRPMLKIDVRDSGIGIAPDKLDSIFEPFVQADASVTRRFGGTGLGLAISQRLAKALGGDLHVTSELGRGSTFTAIIDPGSLAGVAMLPRPSADAVRRDRPTRQGQSPSLEGARILLVEDGETNRKLLHLILRRAGASVTLAENGQIGVEMANEAVFDVILMDMQMPVMDGYTAARRLRDQGHRLPIIALTAHAMKGDEEKCRAAGCTGYLSKPVDADLLLAAVSDNLANQAANSAPATGATRRENESSPIVSSLPLDDREYRDIFLEFLDILDDRLPKMAEACEQEDWLTLRKMAHWLKGSGGTVGLRPISQLAGQLEQDAEQGRRDRCAATLVDLQAMTGRIQVPDLVS